MKREPLIGDECDIWECQCGRGNYNADLYSSCYDCYLDRRADHLNCIFCGSWHSPNYDTCFKCRAQRDEAGRQLRSYIFYRDDGKCTDCGATTEPQIDHIKPCAKGGTASPWNLQQLCGPCNRAKADLWIPGGRHDRHRYFLLSYYFLAGRGWLNEDDRLLMYADRDEYRHYPTAWKSRMKTA